MTKNLGVTWIRPSFLFWLFVILGGLFLSLYLIFTTLLYFDADNVRDYCDYGTSEKYSFKLDENDYCYLNWNNIITNLVIPNIFIASIYIVTGVILRKFKNRQPR